MLNERMMDCACRASEICGVPAQWIYAQWAHESTNITPGDPDQGKPFCSDLARDQNNFGGLTQVEENDTPQPDGRFYYMKFASPEEYARYFGNYIRSWFPRAAAAKDIPEYVAGLKRQPDEDDPEQEYSYFGDAEETYFEGMMEAFKEAFINA